jgi:hypothetical protein
MSQCAKLKASTLRAYTKWLARERKLEDVLKRVPDATVEVARNPPLASTWIENEHLERLVAAVAATEGKPGVLRMARDIARGELAPPLRPLASAVLRLFGTSPATIYRRLNDVVRTTCSGIAFNYRELGPREGVMEIRYIDEREISIWAFVASVPTLEAVLELCGAQGTVADPIRTGPNSATYQIQWP